MAVAFDAKATADTTATLATTISNANLTVGSGSNRALLAVMTWIETGTPSAPSAHWDTAGTNQALTQIGSTIANGTDVHVALFGLLAPTSGNKNLTITWTGSNGGYLSIIAFTGVDQTSVAVAFPHQNSATGTASPATVNIASAVGNYTVACFGATPAGDLTAPLNQTALYAPDIANSNGSGAANYAVGAASNTHSCALSATGIWACIGCDVLASAGGASLVPSWYSPFDPPKRLNLAPAGFAELPTKLATLAVPPKQFPPLFDVVALLKKQTGFADLETNLATFAVPGRRFPEFDPPARMAKVQPGFADLEIKPAVTTAVQTFAPFDSVRLLKVREGLGDLQTNIQTIAQPVRPFPAFDAPQRLARRDDWNGSPIIVPAAVTTSVVFAPFDAPRPMAKLRLGFDDRPAPLPAVSVPMQAAPFDPPMRLRQPMEWQQSPVTTIAVPVPPVFPLAPPFDPPARLRGLKVLETGFAYSPQVIVQINPVIAAVHDHPLFATMGRLMSRR